MALGLRFEAKIRDSEAQFGVCAEEGFTGIGVEGSRVMSLAGIG